MSTKNLLTYYSKNTQLQLMKLSPAAVLPGTTIPINTIFCCLSKVLPWTDEEVPEDPKQDQQYLKNIFANMFVAKQILSNNISPVIYRFDWTSGLVYDYYQDDINMFETDINGVPTYKFYVKNRYDQVFKCLWNNNGGTVINEPFFQPGYYSENNIFQGPDDGYKWKYMYTIDVGSKKTFMDSVWMPVPLGDNIPNPIQSTAGSGDLEVINVLQGGSGYDLVNAAIQVVITGDGTGATAEALVANGSISDIYVTNTGKNYSYANVSVTSTLGANATFTAPASPVGGHAFHPVSELGCVHVMLTAEFNGSEDGIIPTDIDYRQISILINPYSTSSFPYPANGEIYKTSTDLIVASGFGDYEPDELIYQGNISDPTFKATILSFDSETNTVHVINTSGTPNPNQSVIGNTTKTTRTLLLVNTPDWIPYSGYLADIQNRSSVQRSVDGIEQFKFVLGY